MEPLILERSQHPISRRDIDPRVLRVLYRLVNAGHTADLVGGGVRDLMMGRRPKDFDIATSAHPHQVRELFRNSRLIGRRFKLVHVFFGPHNIEVATFRRRSEDLSSDGDLLIRHDNIFGTPEEDAFRRDFTVNALFYDPVTLRVIDYVGGIEDLRARVIRTVGDPEVRMREDPVRMMRAARFAAKLDFNIEPATRAAIERHRADLTKASVPRLVEEVFRLFGVAGAARALALIAELNLLEVLLPSLASHLTGAPVGESATYRNLAALGRAVDEGLEPSHALALACLFLDLRMRGGAGREAGGRMFDLVAELRARGFARGDTERMRLLLDAFPHLIVPTRRTRRLMQRPYFGEARRLYELGGPTYGADPAMLERFLGDPAAYFAARLQARDAIGRRPGQAKRRRRGRRGGRGRRRNRALASATSQAPASNSESPDELAGRSAEGAAAGDMGGGVRTH